MADQPNYVIIVTDQHCADWLGCVGHPVVKTPNIDKLAEKGTRFTDFHVASPVCMPNRASILTGRYPSVHGLKYNGCALSKNARTFVEALRDNGYQTAAIGKSHVQPFTGIDSKRLSDPNSLEQEAWKSDFDGLDIECPNYYEPDERLEIELPYYGYDYVDMVTDHGDAAGGHYFQWYRGQDDNWEKTREHEEQLPHDYSVPQAKRTKIPVELYPTKYIENSACDWLRDTRSEESPFFMWVSFPDPHHPYNPPGKYWDMYHPDQFDVPVPFKDFINPPPPLKFAHERLAMGEQPPTDQEAFAATDQQVKEAMALTAGMITMIDDAVGQIIDTLEKEGLSENTIVVFTSDHGDYLGDGNLLLKGPWMRQSTHQVPFIWSDPVRKMPAESGIIGSSLDIGPTILARSGVSLYFGMQGRNILADVAADRGREDLLIEFNDNVARLGFSKAARSRTLYSKSARITVYAQEGWGELYDLKQDPKQLRNLWNDANSVLLKCDMLSRLAEQVTLAMDESPRSLKRA